MNGRNPESPPVASKERFHCGRFDAYQRNGRIAVEFMAGGDEEQYIDFKPEEAKAFCEWLARMLPAPEPPQPGANMVALLRAARCPNANCDNAGTICVQTQNGPEPEQCQWCDERKTALSNAHETKVVMEKSHDDRAAAWHAVFDQLLAHNRKLINGAECGRDCALIEIRRLQALDVPAAVWRDVVVDNAPAKNPVLTFRIGGDGTPLIAVAKWERVGMATGWHIGDGRTFLARVTHWMALPAAPVTAEKASVCTTCNGTGEVDETFGGIHTSNPHAPCPDCNGKNGNGDA